MEMRNDYRCVVIAAVLLVLLTPVVGHACSCMEEVCNTAWRHGEVVFLGEVTARQAVPSEGTRVAVHFLVREIFDGRVTSEKDTVVFTGAGGGDCGYPFVVGQSYLVYAGSNHGQLATGICSPTRPAVMAGAFIQQLRLRSKAAEPPTLFGMIGIAPRGNGYEDLIESKSLPGVKVRALGSGGLVYSATSDEQGVYSFKWLPADTYQLEIDLPAGLSTWQKDTGKPLVIPIGNVQNLRGCAVDVFARADGRISGMVVNTDGNGVAGFLMIIPADPKQAEAARQHGGMMGFSTDDGKFLLTQIPPGRYQLMFYQKTNGKISFRDRPVRSEPIDIGFGQHKENFEFKLKD
jgi:hypothetical protein